MSITKDEVSDLIALNNQQMMESFKVLLQVTVGQIKRANKDTADLRMREIKKLKHSEPHKLKQKANKDQYKFNLQLGETLDNAKSTAQKSQLEKVKSELEEDVFCLGFWRDQVTPGDRFIQGLTDRLKTTVLSSKAYSTSSQYHRAFSKWKEFAVCKLNETCFPADPFHVALYLQHLIEQVQSPSEIDSAFYGIKWAHDMAGVPSPTDNSVVENVRSAAKRILGTAAVNHKEPISSDLIRKIVSQANLDNPINLRNVTMYVLSFTGFFRFDDISRVRRSDISFHEGFMVIQVQKSKNNQLPKGNEVVISELSSSACPVSLLKRYLNSAFPPIHRISF